MYYQISRNFKKSLVSLLSILEKGQQFCTETNLSEDDFLSKQLASDMLPLTRQIQVATDNVKGYVLRLTQSDSIVYEDDETSIDELKDRIQKTILLVESKVESDFVNADNVKIILPHLARMHPGSFLTASVYAHEFALPNVYFHVVTAYDIMRMAGVSIGKGDYIGDLELQTES
jgi:uncharacterized protein